MDDPRIHPERTDAELMKDARVFPAAFGEIYRRHVTAVHAWCARRAPHVASDLAAETFAQAWLSRRRFRDRRNGSALPWLLGIAANVLRESIRRDQVETRARARLGLPLDLATQDEEDGYEGVLERLSPPPGLADALERLPDHERQALELRVVSELPYHEVADTLAIKPAAARLRVSRALRRLAFALGEQKEDS